MTSELNSSGILESPTAAEAGWSAFYRGSVELLSNVWSSTHFDESSITQYAERLMLAETRKGITVMAALSLLIQIAAIVLYQKLGVHSSFLYTYALLAALSVHVIVSVRFVSDLSALNLLGIILLVITGVAIMAIAHRIGSLDVGLLSSVVLLFMIMPLVPWALREATIIVGLTYITFTLSSLSVEGRFDSDTLWTVQFLIFASAATATLTIVRNTIVRKDDIRARFNLEGAHRELQLVSTRDPLTGAWNRRFIEQNFDRFSQHCHDEHQRVRFALMDIDRFKYFNDTYGHHHGDLILQQLAKVFIDALPGNSYLIRLGGDEFAVLHAGDGLEKLVDRCLNHLFTDPRLLEQSNGEPVTVTAGFAIGALDRIAVLTTLYKEADAALYKAKSQKARSHTGPRRLLEELASTGSMRIKK